MGPIGRRGFLKSVASAVAGGPIILRRNAWAQGKTIHVGIWAGAQGEYIKKNVIAAQVETVIEALISHSFSRDDFLRKLDKFYIDSGAYAGN